jgi:hypothetical protein
MLSKKLRQPRFVALGLPVLFHNQHPVEIIALPRPQYVSGFLQRQVRAQRPTAHAERQSTGPGEILR